ncbi:D-glycero-beta-D-manno-heptose-1,7-bisphosphate 7-phosphatase [Halorhodospira abdelmalekii]|uniref:D-glycero-beta-D-manno-heptose 1,7-bisphosphate 7-phosphatase n=1 Tax=Halorhodospira abdelmalekii TaxID=421629 RepID=UPI00190433FA|nr:D-glycero-beta-D-manno-heptose-1,7-bisphosphate 7-phosphatase [Halorhodospira abdelmalekii]
MAWIILDRDGVINYDSEHFIRCAAQWTPIPGSIEAIAALSAAGWRVAVATNQSGLARGLLNEDDLRGIHRRMQAEIAAAGGQIEAIAYCPHGPDDGCRCRKPQPGLYEDLAHKLGESLPGTPVVGDSARDLVAAVAVAARPLLVETGKGATTLAAGEVPAQTEVFSDLREVAEHLLGRSIA